MLVCSWMLRPKRLSDDAGGLFATKAVQVEVDDWIITLDTYQERRGNHSNRKMH